MWTTPVRKDRRGARQKPSSPPAAESRPYPTSPEFPPLPSIPLPIQSPNLSTSPPSLAARRGGEEEGAARMLWVDKYRPKTLDKVTVHDQVAQNLRKLVSPRDLRFFGLI